MLGLSPHIQDFKVESSLTSAFARKKELIRRSSVKETLTLNPDLTEQGQAIRKDFLISISSVDWVTLTRGGTRTFHSVVQDQLSCFIDRNRVTVRQCPKSVALMLKDSCMSQGHYTAGTTFQKERQQIGKNE